jgi:hypothetical protein
MSSIVSIVDVQEMFRTVMANRLVKLEDKMSFGGRDLSHIKPGFGDFDGTK